jgi:hypothetical protein
MGKEFLDSLLVCVPRSNLQERTYVIKQIFDRTLGIRTNVLAQDTNDTLIRAAGLDGGALTVRDQFLSAPIEKWPSIIERIKVVESEGNFSDDISWSRPVPILFEGVSQKKQASETLDLDIFGTVFLFLSRFEEYYSESRDEFGRATLADSFQLKYGLEKIPIVDLYVEILWQRVKRLWPQLERKKLKYRLNVTHDIDRLYKEKKQSPIDLLKQLPIALRAGWGVAAWMDNAKRWIKVHTGRLEFDSYNSYSFLCEESELHGLESTFYVVADRPFGKKDSNYDLGDPLLIALLSELATRGHKIGLHPSFGTYQCVSQMKLEVERLDRLLQSIDISLHPVRSRQHYLRCSLPDTLQNWEASNITEDSTLGFPDRVGFRAGTCRPFRLYDCEKRRESTVTEYPLLIMEQALLSSKYLNLRSTECVIKAIEGTVSMCRFFDGCMTILWHNSMLYNSSTKQMYRDFIHYCK